MNFHLIRYLFLFFVLSVNIISVKASDTTKFYISTSYSIDLSDTYSGGNLLSSEFTISRYGIKAAFGYFQSQYNYVFRVPYPEIERILEISIPEMAMMKIGTISGFLRPINNNWLTADIVFGASLGRAKCFYMKSIDYEYIIDEDRLSYMFVDYQLHRVNYFGYHAGLDLTFNFSKRIGIQLNSRIHDMSNGGTFFILGSGLLFKF